MTRKPRSRVVGWKLLLVVTSLALSSIGLVVLWPSPTPPPVAVELWHSHPPVAAPAGDTRRTRTGVVAGTLSARRRCRRRRDGQQHAAMDDRALEWRRQAGSAGWEAGQPDARYGECLRAVDAQLPRDETGALRAHHYNALQLAKWNERDRFQPLYLSPPCTIWYVGAHTRGVYGQWLQRRYQCTMHVFEPVPEYHAELVAAWSAAGLSGSRTHFHAYGLGSQSRTVRNVSLHGDATHAMEGGVVRAWAGLANKYHEADLLAGGGSARTTTLRIRDVRQVLDELSPAAVTAAAGKAGDAAPVIDLLHMNCEGCEWEMLETLIQSRLVGRIKTLQIGTHWYPHLQKLPERYCRIQLALDCTHVMEFRSPFGWERHILLDDSVNHTQPTNELGDIDSGL